MDRKLLRNFYRQVRLLLRSNRPQIVFDMSRTKAIDSHGIDVLLRCVREAMKSDGEVKLAGVSHQAAIVLELTRTGRLFEIYADSIAAVKSFSNFLPNAVKQFHPHYHQIVVALEAAPTQANDGAKV